MKHYVYRTTTEKLAGALDRIAGNGDEVLWPVWVGGRDWNLICRTNTAALSIGDGGVLSRGGTQ